MTAPVPVADPCRARNCGHGQLVHRRGRGGCGELDCSCARYEPPRVDQSGESVAELVRQRDAAQAELEQYCAADLDRRRTQLEARQHLAAELGQARSRITELTAEVDRLRAQLDVVNASRLRALDALDEATRISLAEVLLRYDADQCTTDRCGSRYTVPVDHPHPLTPVTVLVVRREVTGA